MESASVLCTLNKYGIDTIDRSVERFSSYCSCLNYRETKSCTHNSAVFGKIEQAMKARSVYLELMSEFKNFSVVDSDCYKKVHRH